MSFTGDQLAIVGILATVVFGVLGFIAGYSAKRPRLEVSGSGSAGISVPNKDIMASSVTFRNNPSFFGLRVNREQAIITSARIYDPELKEFVGHILMWEKKGSQELEHEHTIESGRQGRLYLFAKERYHDEFFVFSASKLDEELQRQPARYREKKKDYSLALSDVNGRTYNFKFTARNTDQSVHIRFKTNKLRSRWHRILEAFS